MRNSEFTRRQIALINKAQKVRKKQTKGKGHTLCLDVMYRTYMGKDWLKKHKNRKNLIDDLTLDTWYWEGY